MAVASYCYYEKVRRAMYTATVSYLLKYFYTFTAAELNNIESQSFCLELFMHREFLWR